MKSFTLLASALLAALAAPSTVSAYTVKLTDIDPLRQTCSGMWSAKGTSVELSIEALAKGTVATIIYDYADFHRIGRVTGDSKSYANLDMPEKTYICTASAVAAKVCTEAEQGNFLIDGATNGTSIVLTRLELEKQGETRNISYPVTKRGYYCVGAAAVPLQTATGPAKFKGTIVFKNSFKGELPAGEYPKLQFYFALMCLYGLVGISWAWMCYKHRDDLLLVQYFISGILALLIVASTMSWLYYRFLNNNQMDYWHIASIEGKASVTAMARFLLVLTSILDATKTSASLASLLCVSMGLSVVRPSIGPIKTRVQILTLIHWIAGLAYAVGVAMILIDAGGGWIFMFIFPLAFTLSTFLMWTLHALNGTIEHLTARKQTYKKLMFTKLYRILLGAVVIVFAFFVVSSFAFTQAGGESSADAWSVRWMLLDGWLGSLYFVVFTAIAYVWRPTGSNARLSMSDELAQDDDMDAEDYEISQFGAHHEREPDEEDAVVKPDSSGAAALGRQAGAAPHRAGAGGVSEGETMFALQNSDDEEEDATPRTARRPGMGESEREGLMNLDDESRETLVPSRQDKRID